MLFPYVPMAPGVPAVARNTSNANIPTVAAASSDSSGVTAAASTVSQWGLFTTSGANVLNPDSVVALDDFLHEFKLSTFPIEQGSFSTYNKVAEPFTGRFIFNKGGGLSARQTFMKALETIVADTNLYVLSTPEISYPNVNVPRYRYRRRSDEGFQLISVELTVEEVRIAPSAAFTNGQDPTSQSPTNTGAVQAQTPSSAQVSQAAGAIPTGLGTGIGTPVVGQPTGS